MEPVVSSVNPVVPNDELALAKPSVYEPEWKLDTDWFLSRGIAGPSFSRQAGIRMRPIAELDESEMALRAAQRLQQEAGCEMKCCRGLVLASSSLSDRKDEANPQAILRQAWPDADEAAHRLQEQLDLSLPEERIVGINCGCSSFNRALEICASMNAAQALAPGEFYLLVTTNRLSERADFADAAAAVFGDYATAVPVVSLQDPGYHKLLHMLYARVHMTPADAPGFTYVQRDSVLYPTKDGGQISREGRVIYQMNGTALSNQAPRLLTESAQEGLAALACPHDGVSEWLHYQASRFITRYFIQFMGQAGIAGKVHDTVAESGNLSSSSLPALLANRWFELEGRIGLPSVGIGSPGEFEMSKGISMFEVVCRD